jgi:hypothetical protein
MTNCWCSWKASDYADSRHNPSPSQPLSVLSSRHNRGVGMLTKVMEPNIGYAKVFTDPVKGHAHRFRRYVGE